MELKRGQGPFRWLLPRGPKEPPLLRSIRGHCVPHRRSTVRRWFSMVAVVLVGRGGCDRVVTRDFSPAFRGCCSRDWGLISPLRSGFHGRQEGIPINLGLISSRSPRIWYAIARFCPFDLGLVRLPSLGGGKGGGAGWIPAIAGYPRATVPQPGGLVKFQKPRSITVMNSE